MAGELTQFGNVIAQTGRDYMNISLSKQAEDRARARQLEDRQASISEEERRFQRGVEFSREERKLINDENFQQAIIQVLVQQGFLRPEDVKDPAKLADAYTEAQRTGLVKRYQDLIDEGLLDPKDMTDQAKVEEAMRKRGQGKQNTTNNAQSEANRLAAEERSISQQITELGQRLAKPTEQPTPNEIKNLALQLATQANGGKTPSNEQISQFMQQANQELSEAAMIQAYQEKEQAKQQLQLLNTQLRDNQYRQNNLVDRFKVAPTPAPQTSGPTAAAPAAQGSRQATAEERAFVMAKAIKDAAAAKTQPAQAVATLANPSGDPEVQAYNAQQEAAAAAARLQPIQAQRDKAQAVALSTQKEIERLRSNPAYNPAGGGSSYFRGGVSSPSAPAAPNPAARAKELSRLFVQLEHSQKQFADAEAQLAQLSPAAAPGMSTSPLVIQPEGKTSPDATTPFAPPNQVPSFNSRLTVAPAAF